MTVTVFFDPIETVIEAFQLLYPDAHAEVCFGQQIQGGLGATIFPDDGAIPTVLISGKIPHGRVPEILAHELAHVAAGYGAEHGEEWERAFEAINGGYMRILECRLSAGDGVIIDPCQNEDSKQEAT